MIDPTEHKIHWNPGEPDGEESLISNPTEEGRIETLKDLVGVYLPKLVERVTEIVDSGASTLVLTPDLYEDEFTPKFHFHAYTLLGMAVKYVMINRLQCQIADITPKTWGNTSGELTNTGRNE